MTGSDRHALRRVTALAPPDRRLLVLTLAAGTAALLAAIALVAFSGALISKAALRPPVLSLGVLIVTVRAMGLTRAVARYGERLASHDLAFRALGRLRGAFFARLAPLVPAGLGRGQADLLSRFVADVDQLQDLYLRALTPPAMALLAGSAAVLAAAVMLPASAAVLVVALLLAGVVVPQAGARAVRRAVRHQAAARAQLSAEILEVARHGDELAVLGLARERTARIADADAHLARIARRDALASALAAGASHVAQGLAVVGTLVVAIPAVHAGRLDGILLASLVFIALSAFEATAPLAGGRRQLEACAAAAGRITEITDATAPVQDPEVPIVLPADGALELDDVRFAWPGASSDLLAGVDLRVAPGEAVALVGPSGAGKSTLAELLVRLRDPSAGTVRLGGVDVRDVAQDDLRRAVRLVAQDDALFTTTIAENVRLARPQADDAEVGAALAAAGLDSWIEELPDGLATMLGENGTTVSGGQRRRIALARALLADARFIVVDEPTAQLDPAGAAATLERLVAHAHDRGQGLLAIVHGGGRPDAFDRVVELRGGRVC